MTSMVPALRSLNTRVTLGTLAIFLVSLWSLSFYASQMLRKDMEQLLGEQQFSTVSVVADSVNADLNDRIEALTLVAGAIDSSMLENPAVLQSFLDRLILLKTHFNAGVHVVGRNGVALADVSKADRVGKNYADNEAVHAVLSEGKIRIGRPVMGPLLKQPMFPMVAPIFDRRDQVIGALIGNTNLNKPSFLDKIAENRYGKTGDFLLIAPQHRLVVTASDRSRIMEALPAPGLDPSIDRFVQGHEGSAVFVNRFGVEVLSSTKFIPAAGWGIAAVLPTAEAFAPVDTVRRRMLLATVLLTLLAGGLTWLILEHQLAPMVTAATTLAAMSASGRPPQPLPIRRRDEIGMLIGGFNRLLETVRQRENALKQSEAQTRALISAIPDLIFTVRRDGEFLAFHAPDQTWLLTAPENFLGRRVRDVLPRPIADQAMKAVADALDSNSVVEMDYTLSLGGEERQFEARVVTATHETVISIVREITGRKRAEAELRIAATAFECQEGMIITDTNRIILRTNQSFTRIMGYTDEEVVGRATTFMRSDRLPASFYDAAWEAARRDGSWQAEVWHRRKNGEVFPQWLTSTAVKDEHGNITHFVITHIDITSRKQQEAKRLTDEAAHRDTLVREVHHRIKNNLQGITGLLRQFAQRHPETASLMNQAIGQVQGISVIHGLQGGADPSSVRLCELTGAIAAEVQALWQSPVVLDIPPEWVPCVIAGNEAVPIALVINELIVNAVKHGGKASGSVSITLRKGAKPDMLEITIINRGQLALDDMQTDRPHSGLQLIAALMPHHGARIVREQRGDTVVTLLELGPPVLSLHLKEST